MDLPPDAPPQALQQQPDEINWGSAAAVIAGESSAFSWRVFGAQALNGQQLTPILELADTPAQAAKLLQAAYIAKGYLLVNVSYVEVGGQQFFYVHEGSFNNVEVPENYERYFASLLGESPVAANDLRRRLALADLHARRAGDQLTVDYQSSEAQTEPRYFVHNLKANAEYTGDRDDLTVAFSNSGSRFLGRYLLGAGYQRGFASGLTINLTADTILTDLGEARNGSEYTAFSVQLGGLTSIGTWSVSAAQTDYEFARSLNSDQNTTVDGDIGQYSARLEQLARVTARTRLTFGQQLEYVDSNLTTTNNEDVFDERYGTIGISTNWQVSDLGDATRNGYDSFTVGLEAKRGIAARGTLGEANQPRGDFLRLLPNASWVRRVGKRSELFTSVRGQYSNDRLPQEQELVLGGDGELTAYLPGALVGDSGGLAKVGFRRQFGPQQSKVSVVLSIFAESGFSRYRTEGNELDGETQSLSDAGASLSLKFGKRWNLSASAAAPIDDSNVDEQRRDNLRADGYFRLGASF